MRSRQGVFSYMGLMGVVMSFQEDLAAAKEAPQPFADVNLEVNGTKYLFRFTQMDGTEYASEVLRHPARMDVPFDRTYGYNLNSLSKAVAPRCAVRIEGDDEVPLSVEEWADLFDVLDGGDMQEIANTVYTLNEFASAKAVKAAKKALTGLLPTSS